MTATHGYGFRDRAKQQVLYYAVSNVVVRKPAGDSKPANVSSPSPH